MTMDDYLSPCIKHGGADNSGTCPDCERESRECLESLYGENPQDAERANQQFAAQLARRKTKDARIAELEAWKAEEQQFLITAATRLGIAGYEGPGILDAIDQLIAKIKLHDAYREVAEEAVKHQGFYGAPVVRPEMGRIVDRHSAAIRAAMDDSQEKL
jgi:predicted Fe-S protein YdhL (DUF1289 family)